MDRHLKDASENKKAIAGSVATFVWLASGVYLFATTQDAHFLSWEALMFFPIGMFAAATLLGSAAFYLNTMLERLDVNWGGRKRPAISALCSLFAVTLFCGEFVGGFLFARFAFSVLRRL